MNNSLIPFDDGRYPMSLPQGQAAAGAATGRLRRYIRFLRRYWWVPVLTLVLALAGAAAFIHWEEPQYTSAATMWEPEKLTLPGGAAFNENTLTYIGTQIELLRSAELAQRTIAKIQSINPKSIPKDQDGRPMGVAIAVKEVPKSRIFQIEATSANPAYSQAYLDALLNVYLDYKKSIRKTVSGDTLDSISEQVLRMETELKTEQEALTAYVRTNNLAVLEEEGKQAGGYLAKMQTELSDLRLESEMLAASEQGAAMLATNTNVIAGATDAGTNTVMVTNYGAANAARVSYGNGSQLSPEEEIELLKMQREKLSKNLRPKHPKIVKLDEQISSDEKLVQVMKERMTKQMAASREAAKEQLALAIQSNKTRTASLMASIREWEGKVTDATHRMAEAERLKADVARTQSVCDRLTLMLQNVDISRNIDQDTMSVLGAASIARRSLAKETSTIEAGVFGGLALGFCLVYLVTIRDDRFNSIHEVNDRFGDVVVGQVPQIPAVNGVTQALLAYGDSRQMIAESYRNLRSAIFFMPSGEQRPKILVVTSAIPGEGKSTIVSNLSRTLAQGGSRVLLVDADFRKGYLHKLLGMNAKPGLAEYLEGTCDFQHIVQQDSDSNFFFISRGNAAGNPGDLFLSPKLDVAFAKMRDEFDYVLVDTSPVFAADDSSTLAPQADGTLFVVRNRVSSAGAVQQALDILSQRQVKVIGLVFNGADSGERSYYYNYADYYHTGKNAGAEEKV